MTNAIEPVDVGQDNYMKLFIQELTYQDPLKPVDNREFMAQMAQFSALQQAATTNEHLSKLLQAADMNHSINLLGKSVRIADDSDNKYFTVKAVLLKENKVDELRIKPLDGPSVTINLDQIIEIS